MADFDIDTLHNKPGHLIRRVHQIIVSLFFEECAEYDITPVQYAALLAIYCRDLTDATRLSGLVAFDRSTLGNVLERLERKGWIVRCSTPDDKRIKKISLTDAGREMVELVEPKVVASQQRFLDMLNKREQEQFMSLLMKVVKNNQIRLENEKE